jgi:hypothetical protein
MLQDPKLLAERDFYKRNCEKMQKVSDEQMTIIRRQHAEIEALKVEISKYEAVQSDDYK